jgi:hypothetical protein
MSLHNLVTRGFGSGGSVNLIVTRGFLLAASTIGQTVLTKGPSGPYFSRKRFEEIWATILAAKAKADELKNNNDKRRLQKKIRALIAATEAQDQIKADRRERELAAELGLKQLKAKFDDAWALIDAANDDDEEAIAMLLAA